MSGSIGGSRIKRAEVEPTLALYINKVLNGFPGFVSAQITGSYNAGTRTDHGDIDIAVHINGNDLKKVKKDFKNYLDSLPDDIIKPFVFGKRVGQKSQLFGAIVTCGFPINGREDEYVQIDNIIVTSENDQHFQKCFLDLDAAKQALIMGLMRVIINYIDKDKVLNEIGMVDLPKPKSNQEYELVLSPQGLSFRLVTLSNEQKEIDRVELWRSSNWDLVEYVLDGFNLNDPYEKLLKHVSKLVKRDNRAKRRIVGIMKSMINVGIGEVGTPKGKAKEDAIQLAQELLKENLIPLKDYLMESN